jgi:hypothetical protein
MELKMENKKIFTNHISPKKVGWKKITPELEYDQAFERTDKLAKIYRTNREFISVVPNVDEDKHLTYVNLGPFLTLKEAKRASDAYLHREGFVIFREDVLKIREEAKKNERHSHIRPT